MPKLVCKLSDIKEGTRVRLRAFFDEGELIEPEVNAEVLGVERNRTIMVCIDESDRPEGDYDGLRELTLIQIKQILS